MRAKRAQQWIESYLYRARGFRALEQSVLAEGERRGFSERVLRRAGDEIGISIHAGCWELPAGRARELTQLELLSLEYGDKVPARSMPAVTTLDASVHIKRR